MFFTLCLSVLGDFSLSGVLKTHASHITSVPIDEIKTKNKVISDTPLFWTKSFCPLTYRIQAEIRQLFLPNE